MNFMEREGGGGTGAQGSVFLPGTTALPSRELSRYEWEAPMEKRDPKKHRALCLTVIAAWRCGGLLHVGTASTAEEK